MTIRVPSFVTRLINAEVSKRNFFKPNGQGNENEFLNKMLPNMLSYRAYKKGYMRDYLEKNIKASITEGMQEKILDFLSETFDYAYFDKDEYECDDVINIRFDVGNEALYTDLFIYLDRIGIKRSAYLRNLIYEYLTQAEYQRERICFNEEYHDLSEAITNELVFQFHCGKEVISALAVALEYSVKSEHWYLLYFKENDYSILYSSPLYKIRRINIKGEPNNNPPVSLSKEVHNLIDSGDFDSAEKFILGRLKV